MFFLRKFLPKITNQSLSLKYFREDSNDLDKFLLDFYGILLLF